MNRALLFILLAVFAAWGCTKELKESERAWNPYSLNEVLVFESSEKQLDTIVIGKIIDNAVADGPTPKLYYHTYLIIHRKLKPKENKLTSTDIFTISSSTPKRIAEIGFGLRLNKAHFSSSYKLKELEKYPMQSLTTKAGVFNDIFKLEPEIYYSKRESSVLYMYWSKKHGYIKFERADGFTWELVKKYTP